MKKALLIFAFVIAILCTPVRGHAQGGGCDDTPENPTLILAGLASGVFAATNIRRRVQARRAANPKK